MIVYIQLGSYGQVSHISLGITLGVEDLKNSFESRWRKDQCKKKTIPDLGIDLKVVLSRRPVFPGDIMQRDILLSGFESLY